MTSAWLLQTLSSLDRSGAERASAAAGMSNECGRGKMRPGVWQTFCAASLGPGSCCPEHPKTSPKSRWAAQLWLTPPPATFFLCPAQSFRHKESNNWYLLERVFGSNNAIFNIMICQSLFDKFYLKHKF